MRARGARHPDDTLGDEAGIGATAHTTEREWNCLYSSECDGLSMSRFSHLVSGYDGPTLLLARDEEGEVLGALERMRKAGVEAPFGDAFKVSDLKGITSKTPRRTMVTLYREGEAPDSFAPPRPPSCTAALSGEGAVRRRAGPGGCGQARAGCSTPKVRAVSSW